MKVGDYYIWISETSVGFYGKDLILIPNYYHKGGLYKVTDIDKYGHVYFNGDMLAVPAISIPHKITPCREYQFLSNLKQIQK